MNVLFLRKTMKEKGISNNELSEKANVPLGTLNKILAGTSTSPKLTTLEALAHILGCSIDDFTDRDDYDKSDETIAEQIQADPDVRMIARARSNMPAIEKEKMMQILKLTFEKYFSEDSNGTGKQD